MNTKQTLLIAALGLTGPFAMAEDNGPVVDQSFTSTLTRADVHAEVLQARSASQVAVNTETGEVTGMAQPSAKSGLTRAQVRAEARHAPRQRNASLIDAG